MKTFCFKLYKAERNAKLHRQINAAGLTYNHCIALHRRYYRLFKKHLHKYALRKHLVKLKKLRKFSYIKELDAQSVEDVVFRIDRAFNLFFSNLKRKVCCSPPKFKKVRCYSSFTLRQHGWKLDEDNHTIIIRGQRYRFFQSRRISGKVKTVTIKRDSLGDIYVYFVTDAKAFEVETRTGKVAGFDFGLKKFLTASNGQDIASPLFFANNSKAIAKASVSCRGKVRTRITGDGRDCTLRGSTRRRRIVGTISTSNRCGDCALSTTRFALRI